MFKRPNCTGVKFGLKFGVEANMGCRGTMIKFFELAAEGCVGGRVVCL